MTRIITEITIRRAPQDVFAYVTTPGFWPKWHPSSISVSGATDHSLAVGEQVTEQYLVAGRRGEVVWTCTERDEPHRWVISGQIVGGGSGVITYTLDPQPDGTHFTREFVYPIANPFLALLDRMIVRRRIEQESATALRQLKARLEHA